MGVMVATVVPSSAAAALSLLEEPESELQSHALRSLNVLADVFWPEISAAVPKIQEMSEDGAFADARLAALVAAKVLFHLGELDEALVYALSAGDQFDVAADTEFAKTLRARCIDDYISQMEAEEAETATAASTATTLGNGIVEESLLPPKQLQAEMKAVFERVVEECISTGRVREAIGVSLDARRLDCVEAAITRGCKEPEERADALAYCFSCAQVCLRIDPGVASCSPAVVGGVAWVSFLFLSRCPTAMCCTCCTLITHLTSTVALYCAHLPLRSPRSLFACSPPLATAVEPELPQAGFALGRRPASQGAIAARGGHCQLPRASERRGRCGRGARAASDAVERWRFVDGRGHAARAACAANLF